MDLEEFLADVGRTCLCKRCGHLCKVAATRNPNARIMRHAKRSEGYCANCALTGWLRDKHYEPLPTLLARSGPQVLLSRPVQVQVYSVLRSAKADAKPEEIDWQAVVANWDLPLAA